MIAASVLGFSLLLADVGSEPLVRTEPLVLREGGTADRPAIFDGRGIVIDLGIDVSEHAWQKEGDLWTSTGSIKNRQPIAAGQLSGLFLGHIPLRVPRDIEAERQHSERKQFCYVAPQMLKPGEMGYLADGTIYFRWPEGVEPGSMKTILPPKPGVSCVTVACSHVVVRNIIARHAANDGFNIHGAWVGVRLENVKALSNADEGISAHDDIEMTVQNAEVAWNGSTAGGVADVNRCQTEYEHCYVHDNLGAGFFFSGRSHTVKNTRIANQRKPFSIREGTTVRQQEITIDEASDSSRRSRD